LIYINEFHVNILQVVNMIMKFPGRKMNFFEQLVKKSSDNPEDYELLITYGFFKYFEITSLVQGEDLANSDILQVVELYNKALVIEPDDWFVHILKSLLYSKLPLNMVNEAEITSNLDIIIEMQSKSERKEPYFVLPYIFYAQYWYEKNNLKNVYRYLENALKAVPQKEIPSRLLNCHFFIPAKELYYRLYYSEQIGLAFILKKICTIYFNKEFVKLNHSVELDDKAVISHIQH
jgi:tetratricopeptide (TPR) repeat protein